ncbi:Bacterial alpha-L-rhamnosidase [Sphingobacterium phlebotomi]|uniref:alpha-L-rhamnosidase n=1 Tax=Sphingobacterium phlebotomi TaxID=2605433 RepID=A0A5D4HBD1_9SPHI|nr:family 78 glycoside hydrolase catalytic domain [Sphingobacterium phlebotomi]TYR37874.1 Bacterial alpha-L-rhamnosidase [Sphingobacterium phlebotomi]
MYKFRVTFLYLLWLCLPHSLITVYGQDLEVVNPKVDLLAHPMLQVVEGYPVTGSLLQVGQQSKIYNKQPALGWEFTKAVTQSAYRIMMSTSPDSLAKGIGEVWDSGKVMSAESSNVLYSGRPLRANTGYAWRVMVWDQDGNQTTWSPISQFQTADTLKAYKTAFYPLQKTDEVPQEMSKLADEVRADFGKASFGQLRLTMTSLTGTDTITIRLGEEIHADGTINREPSGTIRYAEYKIPLTRGRHTYRLQFNPNKRNTGRQAIKMPTYIGEVLPFRYVEIDGYTSDMEASDIIRSTVHYPFDDFASHFESSDSVLNMVWELCKYSIKATSFAGIYVDGDRERIPYEADAYINQLSHYGVDKEYSMARRSHEYLLHNATWPTEWILQSVLMAYNDYLYTGDIRSVRHHYDDLRAKLLLPLRESNGLISTRKGKQSQQLMRAIHYRGDALRDIVDWPHTGSFGMEGNGETDGFVFSDFNAVVNAFHYKALCDMAKLAAVLDRGEDAVKFSEKAEETHQAFQSLLWDNLTGAYSDGIDTDHASLHTNMLAMAFGLVPKSKSERVMAFIRSRGMACSVYGSQFLMDAIYEAGDAEYALSLLTSQDDRSWYNMIRAGSTITMEAWDNKFKPNQDWNHAWGAVPANIIPRKLMGVEPLEPGWGVFRVRPQIGSLTRAKITVPTIKGAVVVSCQQDKSTYTLDLVVPGNTTAMLELPLPDRTVTAVTINGEPVDVKVQPDFLQFPQLKGGSYHVSVDFR